MFRFGVAPVLGHPNGTCKVVGRTPSLVQRETVTALLSAIPAWIVSTVFSRDGGIRATMRTLLVQRPTAWHAVALFLFPVLLLPTATLSRIQGGALHQPKVVGSGPSYFLLVVVEFGYAFFVGGGVSEEPGWRGFLLPRLQERFNPLIASLLVWFPWAMWHAPLDFNGYAGSTVAVYLHTRVLVLVPLVGLQSLWQDDSQCRAVPLCVQCSA